MKSTLTAVILFLAAIVFLTGGYFRDLSLKASIMTTAREIKALEDELARLARQHHSLDARLATRYSPDYLRQRAQELGLYPPREDQVVRLPVNQNVFLSEASGQSK